MPTIQIGNTHAHYHVWGSGEPVLLIAGLASDLYSWQHAVPLLEKHVRVIAFDNRGAGLTAAPPAAFGIDTMADDAAALLDALGVARAHVVGWSLGGTIAQELALRHAERVGTLTLMSTFAVAPARSNFAIDAMIRSVAEGASMQTFFAMMQAWCSTNVALEHKRGGSSRPPASAERRQPLAVLDGIARQKRAMDGFDARRTAHLIGAPTVVMHGTDDIMVPPVYAERLAELIPGASLHWVQAAGHFLPAAGWTGPVLELVARHRLH